MYTPQTWSDTPGSPNAQVNATRLNYMEQGIDEAHATPVLQTIEWDGTNWTYKGSVVTSRPAVDTYVRFVFVDLIGSSSWPEWAATSDLGLKVAA